jgi:cytochrome P450
MRTGQSYDWTPPTGSDDDFEGYDELRKRCPVAHSEVQGWSLLRHSDVLAALHDPGLFSSHVSTHVAVPNGMDGAEHAVFRAVVDRCFTTERVAAFAPTLREIARTLIMGLVEANAGEAEVMSNLAEPYAARAQSAYLGWSTEVAAALQVWSSESQLATRMRDRAELLRVASRFDDIIAAELERARKSTPSAGGSLTHQLLGERVNGRLLTDAELVSMVRNWTAGELGTIAAAVGIIVAFLARHPSVQAELRECEHLRQAAMDEILRLEPPLLSNRRRTTRAVRVAGRLIPANQTVTILWPGVQHDPAVFAEPTDFLPNRDPADNLLYGRGPHLCPGEGLSRLELEIVLDTLFALIPSFTLAGDPIRSSPPAGGFAEVRIRWSKQGNHRAKLDTEEASE